MHVQRGLASHSFCYRRQRKAMTSAFSLGAIRDLTPIFYDNAYTVTLRSYTFHLGAEYVVQLKATWDSYFQSTGANEGVEIEVQKW